MWALILFSRQDPGYIAASFPHMCHGRPVMDRMGIRGWGWYLWCVHASMTEPPHLTRLMARLGDFCLHHRVHKEAKGWPWAKTHAIAPHEYLGSGLDDLFLYHANVQRRHVGVWGHGESESEEPPSRVSFCVHSFHGGVIEG